MFDFAWTEIALIVVVALIAIGPKDLPVAIRTVAQMIKKARRMAAEFQTHVDEMVREANLDEVRSQINEIRNFDIRGEVERAVDPDGSLRTTFAGNPMQPGTFKPEPVSASPATAGDGETVVAEHPPTVVTAPSEAERSEAERQTVPQTAAPADARELDVPAFIPPGLVPRPVRAPVVIEAPAFVPPGYATLPGQSPPPS